MTVDTPATAGDPTPEPTPAELAAAERARRRDRRFALAAMVACALIAIGLFPDLPPGTNSQVYDIRTGQQVVLGANDGGGERAYLDFAIATIDETELTISVVITGHRVCEAPCDTTTVTLYAIPTSRGRQGGLPPSAAIALPDLPGPFTFAVDLPITGNPQAYPWDSCDIVVGGSVSMVSESDMNADEVAALTAASMPMVTIQNWMEDLRMPGIAKLDPTAVASAASPEPLVWAYRLEFQRPGFLRLLSGVVIMVITAASFLTLFVRNTNEGLVGISGLVFGIWSVRGVIVEGDLPEVTLVDILLGLTMAVFITGSVISVAIQVWRRAKRGPDVDWGRFSWT